MTLKQVQLIRKQFEGYPTIITMGGTSTFIMDNYPDNCYLIWDDDNELVYSLQSHREASGMGNSDFPFQCGVFPYSDIESIRLLMSTKNAIDFCNDNAGNLKNGRLKYNMDIISKVGHNTKPDHKPYFK